MPRKPMKPCRHPGCPRLTAGNYCKEHEPMHKYVRTPEERKRYDYQWKKARKRYVSTHPVCEMCLLEKKITLVEEVHHILPLDHGGTHDSLNLMSLCKSCHSRITALMGDRWNKQKEFMY